jgi:hypothetical protein
MERGEPRALGAIQQRLWRLITEPSGTLAALAAEGDADGSALAALIRRDHGLAPVDRLAVYANAYFVRLHDCLREDFGALARALGPATFHDLVKTYLMMHPPARPSLRHAGAHLAEHLATEPFAAIFSRRCSYAADLARLEWAMVDAFFAEDAPMLAREDLAAVAPETWSGLRFETTPSLHLLACAWPVHAVRERFDREGTEDAWDEAPSLPAEATELRVWRLDERVRYRAIARLEGEALEAARAGEPFGVICERVAETLGEAEAASRAAALLAAWVSDGLLTRVR